MDRRPGRPDQRPGLPILVAIVTAQLAGGGLLALALLWMAARGGS